jgi:hypothetical protein
VKSQPHFVDVKANQTLPMSQVNGGKKGWSD